MVLTHWTSLANSAQKWLLSDLKYCKHEWRAQTSAAVSKIALGFLEMEERCDCLDGDSTGRLQGYTFLTACGDSLQSIPFL